jgi:hypothetical protein
MTTETALRIYSTMTTQGWGDIMAKDSLYAQMVARPETVTGRKALIMAGGIRALNDFRDSLQDVVKRVVPNPVGKDGASE